MAFLKAIAIYGIVLICTPLQAAEPDTSFYTAQEKNLIKQLRGRVKGNLTQPVMYEDHYLIRFLRAQKLDLQEAESMIHRNLVWRRQENMDNIFKEDWSSWLRKYPFALNMVDYKGKPALSTGMGKIDVRKIVLSGKQLELDRYLVYGFERGVYNVHQGWLKTGLIDGYLIFNMAGYSARTHACLACLPSWLKLIVNYESYYPRLVAGVYIVNTPRIFEALLEILKSVISAHTLQITHIYDYNKAHWSKELAKVFPEASLSPEFGGKGPAIHAKSLHDQNIHDIIYYNRTVKSNSV